jgi:Zn-dependent protease
MKRRYLFSYAITLLATAIGFFAVIIVCGNYYGVQLFDAIIRFLIGAIIAGFLNTVAHELGHYFAGKKNGFAFSSMVIWFFKWKKVKNKTKFEFVMMGDEAGYTEMIPTQTEDIDKKFIKMTNGGIFYETTVKSVVVQV